jgi:RNA polymerase sigma-70 factor (ECF subfamily)
VTAATLEDVVAADPKPTNRPDQAFEVQEIYATIAELPDNFRLALVAVDVLGLSYREAAQALQVREATLTTRLFRARKQVAEHLDPASSPEGQPASGVDRSAASEPPRIADPRREGADASGVSIGEGMP